ncbi:MAG: acyl-CoA/acyl-ACP dehydrogenase [Planctomycetaceae bacterium]|nr:acyl-CoA/acyl-ACP dehydrogenase [Planctomycetaceae bacterium]
MSTNLHKSEQQDTPAKSAVSFAETALRLGGKSVDEARRTGAVDSADDNVEAMFAERYRTVSSPVHRAVWADRVPTELFDSHDDVVTEDVRRVMRDSLAVVRRHRAAKTLLDEQSKISDAVLHELADAGYWGALIDRRYGGCGFPFSSFASFLTEMATVDPTIAGLASVHGCIGAVDPVRTFGTAAQKERYLPLLASGRRLSAFALTEPGAGSDLTALRTTAVRDGDSYVINGDKLFITNATCGRTIGLVCRIDGVPAVLIVDLPEQEDHTFRMNRYGLHALRHAHNNGLLFRNFRVPAENLLEPGIGDGLTIAYHGLNLGRIALCANAAGTMRMMLAEMLPWAGYRKTYGQPIAKRELVRRRIGQMAGLVTASDALVRWTSGLIDEGYRGEMECIIAKVFGSEALKLAAIELYMKTHGGRAFLHGHLFGDNVHEFLAPSIYEGEGEMLSMAFFKSLVKEHGKDFFEPIGQILFDAGIRKPNLANPRHLWMLRKPMLAYATWYAARRIAGVNRGSVGHLTGALRRHAEFATGFLAQSSMDVSGIMRRHQLKLADRQCAMSLVSQRLQDAVTILVTALYAGRSSDSITQAAADCICRDLRRRITGGLPTESDFRAVTEVGEMICETEWPALFGVESDPIMMSYSEQST